jgi:DNA-directed RNA polymerase I subunit RPA49
MAAHDDKKRKRATEGADAPNKKASSAAITVRFPASRDELHPVIGMRNLHGSDGLSLC